MTTTAKPAFPATAGIEPRSVVAYSPNGDVKPEAMGCRAIKACRATKEVFSVLADQGAIAPLK